jgi:hypothetical protein
VSSRSEKSRRSWYRDLGIREFGGPEDEGLDTRHQKFQICERIGAIHLRKDACREIIRFGDSGIGTHRGERLDFASGEVAEESEPSVGRRTRVARSSLSRIQTSGVRGGSLLTSRVAKSREDQNRLSEEDRWQRSRDLANSEVRKVRAQELGAPSREWRNREEQGSPLDPGHGRTIGSEPHHAYRAFGGSRLRGPLLDIRSREIPITETPKWREV